MMLAAHYSGKAISISKTIAPHAVSYPFSSFFGISHGHAVSINFEKILYFNYKNLNLALNNFDIKFRYKILFKLFNVTSIDDLCKKINLIKKKANLEDDYRKLGINIFQNIDKIINNINLLRLKNNPIRLNKVVLKKIILNKF